MNWVTLYFRGLGPLCIFLLIHSRCSCTPPRYCETTEISQAGKAMNIFKSSVGKVTCTLKTRQVLRVLLGWNQRFQSWFTIHSTLAWSSILIKGKAWVACTGVGTGHIGTQLLAVAVATFIYIYRWERWKVEWSAFSHAGTKQQTHCVNGTNNTDITQHITAKLSGVQTQSYS